MSRLQDRRVRLLIANRVSEDYKSLTTDVTEITDLRVKFSVKKSSAKERTRQKSPSRICHRSAGLLCKRRVSNLFWSAAMSKRA